MRVMPASGAVAAFGTDRGGHDSQCGAGGGPGSGACPGGLPRRFDDVRGTGYRNCCCAKGSSTPAGRPGPVSTKRGCARSIRSPALQLAYDTAFDTMLATVDRRDRLDDAIAAMAADAVYTPVVTRLGCLRGVSTLTAFGLAVEIGDWHRLTGRSIGAYLGLVPYRVLLGSDPLAGRGHQDRQRARPPAAGRGGLAPPPAVSARGGSAAALGAASPAARARGQAGEPAPAHRWAGFDDRKKRPWSPTPRSPANWPAGAGRWPCSTTEPGPQLSG